MNEMHITVILNLHGEGALAKAAIRSLLTASKLAEGHGLQIEIIAVLDRASAETVAALTSFQSAGIASLPVACGDIGLARNAGIAIAKGEYVAFLDGDDLWSENWLVQAHKIASKETRPVIYHPQINLFFGDEEYLFRHIDMDEDDFVLLNLFLANYWTALSFGRRDLYLLVPYRSNNHLEQMGYEDWSWHLETISSGIIHKIVPDTIHAIRVKQASLLRSGISVKAMPRPSNLLRKIIEAQQKYRG